MIIFGNIKQQSTEYMRGITDAQHDVEQHGLKDTKSRLKHASAELKVGKWYQGYKSFLSTRQALLADLEYQASKCLQNIDDQLPRGYVINEATTVFVNCRVFKRWPE